MAITGGMLGAAQTATTQEEFVPELWSDGIYRYFERATIFKGLIEDYSSLVKGAGDTVNIPQIDLVASGDKDIDTLVTYDATHSTSTQLLINKHKYNAMLFEDILQIQSNADLVAKYTSMFGEALARAICMEYECDQADPSFFGIPHENSYKSYQPYKSLLR